MSGMVEDPLDSADISSAEEKRCLWYIISVSPSYPDLTELRAARSLASLADTCAPPGAALCSFASGLCLLLWTAV